MIRRREPPPATALHLDHLGSPDLVGKPPGDDRRVRVLRTGAVLDDDREEAGRGVAYEFVTSCSNRSSSNGSRAGSCGDTVIEIPCRKKGTACRLRLGMTA
ncbi:hypothetical protein ACFXKS_33375 [Streptomyces scopuliridis]|uniref:hypothetical protein n=1 Tax=Streptomyces scopuliridis TaxID=452529 RepID=UPI0036891DF9